MMFQCRRWTKSNFISTANKQIRECPERISLASLPFGFKLRWLLLPMGFEAVAKKISSKDSILCCLSGLGLPNYVWLTFPCWTFCTFLGSCRTGTFSVILSSRDLMMKKTRTFFVKSVDRKGIRHYILLK